MGADLGRAVAEHARALGFELVACRKDIVDLVADVVDAAVRIALQELGDRLVCAERLQQLDLGVRQRNEHRVHAMGRLRHHGRDGGAERLAIDIRCLGDVADRNGDVVQSSDHEGPPPPRQSPSIPGRAG